MDGMMNMSDDCASNLATRIGNRFVRAGNAGGDLSAAAFVVGGGVSVLKFTTIRLPQGFIASGVLGLAGGVGANLSAGLVFTGGLFQNIGQNSEIGRQNMRQGTVSFGFGASIRLGGRAARFVNNSITRQEAGDYWFRQRRNDVGRKPRARR